MVQVEEEEEVVVEEKGRGREGKSSTGMRQMAGKRSNKKKEEKVKEEEELDFSALAMLAFVGISGLLRWRNAPRAGLASPRSLGCLMLDRSRCRSWVCPA